MNYSFLKGIPGAFPKGETRRDHKLTKLAAEAAADRTARNEAWWRCKGRCEKCGKPVARFGGLIHGAHFHHRIRRSKGGKKTPIYQVRCKACHFNGPSGAHTTER